MSERRLPPPWSIEGIGGCFVVKASNDRPPTAREVIDPNCRMTGRRKHRKAAVIVTQVMIGSMVYIKIRVAKHCPNPKCLISTLARHHGLSQEYHHLTTAFIQ